MIHGRKGRCIMPRDDWRRDQDRAHSRRAGGELARDGELSSYEYLYDDTNPAGSRSRDRDPARKTLYRGRPPSNEDRKPQSESEGEQDDIDSLLSRLDSATIMGQREAAWKLAECENAGQRVISALERTSRSVDPNLARASMQSIDAIRCRQAAKHLKSKTHEKKMRAIEDLASLASANVIAVEHLRSALRDDNSAVRLAAIRTLGSLGKLASSARTDLDHLAKCDVQRLRTAARDSVRRIDAAIKRKTTAQVPKRRRRRY